MIWLAGSFIVAILLSVFVSSGKALDINLHDTYIIGGGFGRDLSLSSGFAYFITLSFLIYFIRVLYFEFKVISANVIFLILTGLALYFLGDIIFILHPPVFDRLPPISEPVNGLFYGNDSFRTTIWVPRLIKILLMLILAFTGFMIGKNWKVKSDKSG